VLMPGKHGLNICFKERYEQQALCILMLLKIFHLIQVGCFIRRYRLPCYNRFCPWTGGFDQLPWYRS